MMQDGLTATKVDIKVTQFNNEEALLRKINPDLFRVYRAMMTIIKFGGTGSFEVHMNKGKIKDRDGLWIKPGFNDDGVAL